MSADKDPNVKELSNTGELTKGMSDFLSKLFGQVQRDDDDRAIWKEKCLIAINQRLGVKQFSDYPYPGAPDIPLPETDKIIKKQVPYLVNSAWSPKDLCLVKIASGYQDRPEWNEKAKKCQKAMNQLLRSRKLDWFKKLWLAADYAKTYGHSIFRVREEFRSSMCKKVIDLDEYDADTVKAIKRATKKELRKFIADRYQLNEDDEDDIKAIDKAIDQLKKGDTIIELNYEDVESFPQVDIPLPTRVIVPPYTTDINGSQRTTYEYFLSRADLEMMMDKKIFRKKDLNTLNIGASTGSDNMIETQKQQNEGVNDSSGDKDLYRIHECVTLYREQETEPLQLWVFVWLADVSSPEASLLKDVEFPLDFNGENNYEKFDNELRDERYHSSRGVPEEIRAYQEVMERAINNMLIRDEMVNTPMWEVANTSELLDAHIRFMPGAKLPVKAVGQEVAQIGSQSMPDMSSSNILQLIKGFTEEYQSSDDYLFNNATNAGGEKTLGALQTGMRRNAGPQTIEVLHWNVILGRVYQKMFEIMKDRLGESIYIDDMEVTREDFNFPAEVTSNGDLEVADMQMATQKAQMRLQVLLNPALQDIVNSEDRYNALKDWLEKDGVKDPDMFCTDPKKIAQEQISQMQGQIKQMGQQMQQMAMDAKSKKVSESLNYKDLPPDGKVQLAAQAGIQLNPAGVLVDHAHEKGMLNQPQGQGATSGPKSGT